MIQESASVRGNDNKIVGITDITGDMHLMLYELIERVQVDIREKLAREISDGKPRRETSDDFSDKPHCIRIVYFLADNTQENIVINRLKKLFDIAFQYEARPGAISADSTEHRPEPTNTPMGALSLAAGVGIVDETPFKNRIQNAKNSMVNNAIPNSCFMDVPDFRVSDVEPFVCVVLVGLVGKLPLKVKHIFFKPILEGHNIFPSAFAGPELFPGSEKIFRRYDTVKKI